MRKSRLSAEKQRQLQGYFISGATALCAARLVGVNKTTAAYYFHRLRTIIFQATADEMPFVGEIEVDESYFGGTRKGKRGRGAAGKVAVFGLLKRGGKVYARVIPATNSETLLDIIHHKIVPDSIVYTDGYQSYNQWNVSGFRHYRINHSEQYVNGRIHINGIENFWRQAKRHLSRFNGIPREHFPLFLKECEWRFNTSDPKMQLKQLRQWIKQFMG